MIYNCGLIFEACMGRTMGHKKTHSASVKDDVMALKCLWPLNPILLAFWVHVFTWGGGNGGLFKLPPPPK